MIPTTVVLATAYCDSGLTASGIPAQPGVVAVDPRLIPLGTSIRIRLSPFQELTFVAADTGGLIRGGRLDVFMPSCADAIRFGVHHLAIEAVAAPPRATPGRGFRALLLGRCWAWLRERARESLWRGRPANPMQLNLPGMAERSPFRDMVARISL
jgi:3D (Asp-Asp-Asp) domain-containing protein